MSVINKMLRDLDHRQAPESGLLPTSTGPDPRKGTASLANSSASATGVGVLGRLGMLLVGAGLLAAAAGWWWQRDPAVKSTQVVSAVAVPAAVPVVPAVASALAVPQPPSVVQAPPAAMASEPLRPAPVMVAQAPAIGPVHPVQRAIPAAVALRMDATLSLTKLGEKKPSEPTLLPKTLPPAERPAALQATAPTTPPSPDPAQLAQRQQQAGKDAIAHAQSLWNAGSREAAIELMTDVVATAERVAASMPTPANLQLLVLPVRELTRMHLAQTQPQAVWDLLTRLEPQLGNQADLWAVRANAAQRLGRHQDSVHAYMTALQSRPNEQRWLLGAAVSLAALGKTANAADMAEKARAMGVVSKDVLAYLRQMGVPIKD